MPTHFVQVLYTGMLSVLLWGYWQLKMMCTHWKEKNNLLSWGGSLRVWEGRFPPAPPSRWNPDSIVFRLYVSTYARLHYMILAAWVRNRLHCIHFGHMPGCICVMYVSHVHVCCCIVGAPAQSGPHMNHVGEWPCAITNMHAYMHAYSTENC